jgi:hypothetical protein
MPYSLRINYKSNERPYSTDYRPYGMPEDDAKAIEWAKGMQEGMGQDYTCVLYRDGEVIFDAALQPA